MKPKEKYVVKIKNISFDDLHVKQDFYSFYSILIFIGKLIFF